MADSKVLLLCDFTSDITNKANNSYSFEIPDAYDILNGYIGGTLSSLNTFNLNKNWIISFYYQWRNSLSPTWNHLFAFGIHKNSSVNIDIASYAISINGIKPNTKLLYNITSLDNNMHFYEIEYIKNAKAIFVRIDNKLVNIVENVVMPENQMGLYFSGGYNGLSINAKIKDFKFEIFYEKIDVSLKTDIKTKIISSQIIHNDTYVPGKKYKITTISDLKMNVVKSIGAFLSSNSNDESTESTAVDLVKNTVSVDENYLVNLNFNDSTVRDFGTLKFNWISPTDDHFVESKFSISNPVRKSLYFDGSYYLQSFRRYFQMPKIYDFCIELDFMVSDDLKFSTPYSRVYLASANINTYEEYHSTLADIYLLPKYKDEEESLSLTIESNDLYRNTGNIIYTYGWIKRNELYSLIYTRQGNRFYILINDELVYDETLDNTITYEPGHSKPNRRYFGYNYLNNLEIGLGRSVKPSNVQDLFVGYIDKFNISGIARFDPFGHPINFIKETIISTYRVRKEYSPWRIVDRRVVVLQPGEIFIIDGYTITGGPGGTTLIGLPGQRLIVYSGTGEVVIKGPPEIGGIWFIPGGGYYGVLYQGVFTVIDVTVAFDPTKILAGEIIFIGDKETYIFEGISIVGVPKGLIIIGRPEGGYIIRGHIYPVTIVDIYSVTHIIPVRYMAIFVNRTIVIVEDIYLSGKDFPIPPWVHILPNDYDFPPYMVQNIEKDVLVYVPCKQEDFDKDVIYSKVTPREDNYYAYKIGGAYYADYWRDKYGAIGPE